MFDNTNPRLVDAVVELASSLGQVPNRSARTGRGFGRSVTSEHVEWQPSIVPATLPRKVGRIRPRSLRTYRVVTSIEKVESVPTQCIAVDSPTRTYLAGRAMVPTHNTTIRQLAKMLPKSPEVSRAITHDGAVRADATPAAVDVQPDYIDGEFSEAPGVDDDPHVDNPVDNPPADDEPGEPDPTPQQRVAEYLQGAGITDPDNVAGWLQQMVGDPDAPATPADLTADEAVKVLDAIAESN